MLHMADRPPRILLVDDEQPIQTLLSFPLQKDGYEVVRANDGREALQRFGEGPFDLVVLDVMMPKMDGLEVCRRLRARSTVPIIMLTAKAEEIDKVLGLELGADDYITKPFSLREFRSRVRAALRRAGMARANACTVASGLTGGPSRTCATRSGCARSGSSRVTGTRLCASTATRRFSSAAPTLMASSRPRGSTTASRRPGSA